MPQRRKQIWKRNRDVFPCIQCGEEHLTRDHGKSDEIIAQQRFSRASNPRDPQFKELRVPSPILTDLGAALAKAQAKS